MQSYHSGGRRGLWQLDISAREDDAHAGSGNRQAPGKGGGCPSAPVGSTTSFSRSHRENIVCRRADLVDGGHVVDVTRTSGNVSDPSDGVRAPSATVCGLSTVCSCLVRNDRVASSPAAGSTPMTRQCRRQRARGDGAARQQPAAAAGDEQEIERAGLFEQLDARPCPGRR